MLGWAHEVMARLGYPGIALLMFLENVFPPIPSEVIMPLAGFTAAQGELNYWGVWFAGAVGSVLGSPPLYGLGRALGGDRPRRWADRHGKWLTIDGEELEKAQGWFDRHGQKAVFLCQLVPGVRSLISIPAGVHTMSVPLFLAYTALGVTIWTGLLTFLGHLLGANYALVGRYLGPATYVVLGGLLLAAIAWVARRKRGRAPAGTAGKDGASEGARGG
jgi:membrane protein DedA with SNARE-associated domain